MTSSNIADGNLSDYYATATAANQPQQTAITAFLAKLWALVNDPSCDDLIAWDPSGGSFHVFDQSRFAREILPRYFKHNNFASFIRQLNMYGFRKISTIEHGSLKSEHDDIEFAHPHFIRGHDTLLELIKRRAPDNQQKLNIHANKTELTSTSASSSTPSASLPSSALISAHYVDTKPPRPIEISQLIDDVRNLQAKQTSLSDKLFHMQDENQALWREISVLKQKHSKQQQIVSKLMEFLLHFLTNAAQTQRPSVEQSSTGQNQKQQTKHTIVNAQIATNSLKRKPAALMLSEEPNKRQSLPSKQQHVMSKPISIERQTGIIINELTDSDTGGWPHTTDTSPLVDLVPSPPPVQTQLLPALSQSNSIQSIDDHYQVQPQKKTPSNFEWPVQANEICDSLKFPQKNTNYKMIGNDNNEGNSFVPDFFLNTDNNDDGTKTIMGPIDEANLTGINPSSNQILPMMKAEELDFSSRFHQKPSTHHEQAQQIIESNNSSDTVPFILHDITGDVNHIQASLDNIRELMFDNLPDTTTIEDLFCDDHVLLSPLLANNGQTTNILTDTTQDEKLNNNNNYSYSNDHGSLAVPTCKQIMLHKCEVPSKISELDVNNRLLEQLITETAIIEEQRQTINQLEREKLSLEGKIQRFEQQNNINSRK